MNSRILPLFSLLAAAPGFAAYTFTGISDNTGPIDSYQGLAPAMSSTGAVAFVATLDPPVSAPPYAAYRWENGVTTLIAATADSVFKEFGEPAISADGSTITFAGAFDDENKTISYFSQGVARHLSGGSVVSILDQSTHSTTPGVINVDEFPYASETGGAAASGGKIAYVVRVASVDPTPFNSKRRRIYAHDGSIRTLLVEDGTTRPASGGPNSLTPKTPGFKLATADFYFGGMNSSGTVAFRSRHPDIVFGVSGSIGIYTAGPAGVAPIMEEGIQYEVDPNLRPPDG